jgi:hypothetical protein
MPFLLHGAGVILDAIVDASQYAAVPRLVMCDALPAREGR